MAEPATPTRNRVSGPMTIPQPDAETEVSAVVVAPARVGTTARVRAGDVRPIRVLGIDPGSVITGYALVESAPGAADAVLQEAGIIRLGRAGRVAQRLVALHADITELLTHAKPDVMAIEKLYAHYGHPLTAIQMAHARGVILLAASLQHVEIIEVAATEVKKAMTGNGHATKRQIQHAVQAQCRLSELPTPADVADAIAIALTVARRSHTTAEIEEHTSSSSAAAAAAAAPAVVTEAATAASRNDHRRPM